MFQGLIDSNDVLKAVEKVARTGSPEDLREYIKLRKRYLRRVAYSEHCRQEAKLIGHDTFDPEGARQEMDLQRQINRENARNVDGFYD